MNITNSSNLLNPQQDDGHLCGTTSEESGDEENSLSELDPTNNRPHFENNLPCVTTWKRIWENVTIEPIMFAHMFSMSISGVVLQNLYIQRICIVTLATPHQICKNLGNYTELGLLTDKQYIHFFKRQSYFQSSKCHRAANRWHSGEICDI